MKIVPITFKKACEFVNKHHRHNKAPVGHKFSIGLENEGLLIGVAMAGRPIARNYDDGFTLEVNRTCTDGSKNANSMLYGAVWRAAKAMGYIRLITYTQANESGASLKASGFINVKNLKARKSWYESSSEETNKQCKRNQINTGGVERILWEIKR